MGMNSGSNAGERNACAHGERRFVDYFGCGLADDLGS
jgi:hypothetical protein